MRPDELVEERPPRVLAGIVLLCVGFPLLSAVITGSIRIPHNDDWAYFRIVFHLADEGLLRLVGWNEITFVGQLLWAFPVAKFFGPSVVPIVVVNALIAALGLVLTYHLARGFLGTSYALLTALVIGVFPGFMVLVTTFMTDTAGYTAQVGCLVLGLRALDARSKDRLLWLAGCLAVGLYGFSVREFALVAPVAVLIAIFFTERRDRRVPTIAIAASGAFLGAAAALYWWRHTFAASSPHFFGFLLGSELLVFLAQMFFTVSLGLVPAAVFLVTNLEGRLDRMMNLGWFIPVPLMIMALLSAGTPTCCLDGSGSVFLGNLLTEYGVLDNQVLPGERPPAFPFPIWGLLSGAAVVSGAISVGRLRTVLPRQRRRSSEPHVLMLAGFGAIEAGAVIFRGVLGGPIFDRYLTPLVLVAAIFLLRGEKKPTWSRNRGAFVVTGLLAAISLILVSNGHAFDVARWRAAEVAVTSGVPADHVDGGFEWVGYHYDGVAQLEGRNRPLDFGPGYLDLFPRARNCAVVSASLLNDPRLELIDSVPYRTLLGLRSNRVWVYRFAPACADVGA